ncbi:MAG: DUF4910 domain-containing protein, partial [Rubricoccaceae bacterium]|nr:DUF4910 domain-containing protein [Rubricoccaceae bacterium]
MPDRNRADKRTEQGNVSAQGAPLMGLVRTLFPICRSITGDGVRHTLDVIGQQIHIQRYEIPTGTRAHDWEVPLEWNIRDAWIKNRHGERVVDFCKSNLHVVSYSVPVHEWMSLEQLRPHLHCLQDHPDWIPYRTSYYERNWGFCLAQRELERMTDTHYEVYIDSMLAAGSLSFGEVVLPGQCEREVLFSAHICHPSLCNDNLSGIAVAVALAKALAARRQRHNSYRFLFAPGTIGSVVWLSQRSDQLKKIIGGMTLVCLGDDRKFTYKKSVGGHAVIDRAAALVMGRTEGNVVDFHPYGYDERQFNSPGFRLPVGSLMRA